jgi:hypothetical protein
MSHKVIQLKAMFLTGLLCTATATMAAAPANQAIFFEPTPYRSTSDIPAGFYASGSPTLLENFEDLSVDASLSFNRGDLYDGPTRTWGGTSVDADDGAIDNNGNNGRSWGADAGYYNPLQITYNGNQLPTAFGLVVTAAGYFTRLSAFDSSGQLIGSYDYPLWGGDTQVSSDDRFIGLQYAGGIKSVQVMFNGGWTYIDHVQYGQMAPVPEPETYAMLLAGLGLMGAVARRRNKQA